MGTVDEQSMGPVVDAFGLDMQLGRLDIQPWLDSPVVVEVGHTRLGSLPPVVDSPDDHPVGLGILPDLVGTVLDLEDRLLDLVGMRLELEGTFGAGRTAVDLERDMAGDLERGSPVGQVDLDKAAQLDELDLVSAALGRQAHQDTFAAADLVGNYVADRTYLQIQRFIFSIF